MKEASVYDELIYKTVHLESDEDKEKVYRLINHVIKETWNEALDKAAENADVTDLGIEGNAVVDLNSILKLKL